MNWFFLKTLKSQPMLVIIVFTCLPVRINPTHTHIYVYYVCETQEWTTLSSHVIFLAAAVFYYSDKWIRKLSINCFPQKQILHEYQWPPQARLNWLQQ